MNDPMIEIRGLWKRFEKGGEVIEVLKGIDLEVFAGDRISIVGQSGSGKSTFLQILGTLDRPSEGTVNWNGQPIFELTDHKVDQLRNQNIGFVFQFHHLLPDHTACRNVALPLIIGGVPVSDAEQKACALLERVGLGHRFFHKPGELSGGEQQRVAIARALVNRPKLLLADEPTGNLDPKTAEQIMELLLSLQSEIGGALVMVTHDIELAQGCPRRLTLVDGQFVEAS
ncbi:MAG: ABC transporter ATP-binding protein [Myxococcota bacterium]|nr:ABC transporter ATP-binding protein [Myxococcota bacterium]